MGMMMGAMRRGRGPGPGQGPGPGPGLGPGLGPGPGKGQFSSREANWVWHALKRKITCKEEEKEEVP